METSLLRENEGKKEEEKKGRRWRGKREEEEREGRRKERNMENARGGQKGEEEEEMASHLSTRKVSLSLHLLWFEDFTF